MFRIGEFSKITQVSGHSLRYYDEIGLLTPAKIDEWTGYRYYSAQQIPRLNRIMALKDLGLSLEQIKRMLDDHISSEEIRGMFALKKAQIEQTLRDEMTRLQHVEARLQQLDEGNVEADIAEVVVKSVPEQPFLSLRETVPSFEAVGLTIMEMHKALPSKLSRRLLGAFTAILHTDMYQENDLDLEMGFSLMEPTLDSFDLPSKRKMSLRILPEVPMMATIMRVGTPNTSHLCRAPLAAWVEVNGYEFAGVGRELFLVPPRPGREDETVLEVQYPIVPVKPTRLAF
ncbi:MAG: MerR family transcriptional regulator [Chloroflexota bacterium]